MILKYFHIIIKLNLIYTFIQYTIKCIINNNTYLRNTYMKLWYGIFVVIKIIFNNKSIVYFSNDYILNILYHVIV